MSVHWLVGQLVVLVGQLVGPLFSFWQSKTLWAHHSFPNAQVTLSVTAPAHPHTTGVAVSHLKLAILIVGQWV